MAIRVINEMLMHIKIGQTKKKNVATKIGRTKKGKHSY